MMISTEAPREFVPYGRVLLPIHPQERGFSSSQFTSSCSLWMSAETETSRDLFKPLKDINIHNDLDKERWLLRQSDEGEEELYSSGKTCVWSRSDSKEISHLIKTFTLEDKIYQAIWCGFKDEKIIPSICIVDTVNLEIFTNDGNHYPIALQFQVNKIYSTKFGIILERMPLTIESNPLPVIFSLTHPLKEIAPIIFKSNINYKTQILNYLTVDSKLNLVDVIEEHSLVIFYHKSEGTHYVFVLREVTEDEVKWSRAFDGENVTENYTGSPFISSERVASFPSYASTPFRSLNVTKQTSTLFGASSSNIINPSIKTSTSSSPSVLSPLRSSRLPASPASPNLRSFGSPSVQAHGQTPSDPQMSKIQNFTRFSPFTKSNATPLRSKDFDYLNEDIYDPIIPELTLEHVWSESLRSSNEKASKVFITTDLMGQKYLSFLLKEYQQLKLVRLDQSNDGQKIIFGTINIITAFDAESVPALNMILVIDNTNSLVLYSGLCKMCLVYLPSFSSSFTQSSSLLSTKFSDSILSPSNKRSSLLASSRPTSTSTCTDINPAFLSESKFLSPVLNDSISDCENDSIMTEMSPYKSLNKIISIQDSVNDKVTVQSDDLTLYRLTLPSISISSTVSLCLSALKSVLPKDIVIQLYVKWYSLRNSPGLTDFIIASEFNLFKSCLLSLIGYDIVIDDENMQIDINDPSKFKIDNSSEVVKKIKLDLEENTDDDWKWLQLSSINNQNKQIDFTCPGPLFSYLPSILYSLHLIYEEFKLATSTWSNCEMLVDILYMFAVDLNQVSYQDHYWRDFPIKCNSIIPKSRFQQSEFQNLLTPSYFKNISPSIFSTLRLLITNSDNNCIEPFPYIDQVTNNIHNMIILFANVARIPLIDRSSVLAPINSITKNGINFSIDTLNPNEKIITLMNKLNMDQSTLHQLPSALSIPLWDAILNCRHNPCKEWNAKQLTLIGRTDLCASEIINSHFITQQSNSEVDEDGFTFLNNDVVNLIFPKDRRVFEAANMLLSSKPVKIAIQQKPGVSDHDFIEEQERHLYSICIRTMALPLGRAMLTFRSYIPVVAETFPIPKLNLMGRVPPRNNTIDLSHIEVPASMNTWPLFHNGVAAGLRASLSASKVIDSTWIVYNRPKSSASLTNDASNEHAGFLLALGLNGHLARLSTMNIHDYLCKGSELTRVAVLLGIAAAKRGTMDVSAVKVLSIHVEALLPPTSTELDVPPIVQVAAVMGIGLVYQGTGQHHISEVLLGEIGRPPGPEMEHYIDRESYALAAGLAFGLVTLGKGNDMIGLVSSSEGMSMADQLCHYMLGGHKRPLTSSQREKYKTPSYQIREGDCINADVTSPGATLALGMMFFNTNNGAVAKWVEAPDTQRLLEMVRPDFLLLRALSRGLIMWSYIEPSIDWIQSHIPHIVLSNAFLRCDEILDGIDYETMSQAYCNIVAGACFALSLKYAGSANENAFKTVMFFTNKFISLTSKPSLADQAGRSTIESCLNVLVISLAIIMAGTGNLEVMRICRLLRSRLNQVYVLYGSHMAIHMALGLLFLSGCRYTLSSSPESVAALICAFFPKYPIHSNDNRYHLQAFRHLWVLAAEQRLVIPRDIDTKKAVYVHLKYRLNNSNQFFTMKAPCFLPELNSLQEVIVDDERYWFISFEKNKNWKTLELLLKFDGFLYVKQKTGCLPYKDDPKGFKSLHAQSMMKDAVRGWSYKSRDANEFSNDTIVLNFTKYLHSRIPNDDKEAKIQQMFCSILFDCAVNERVDILQLLIDLAKIAICDNLEGSSVAFDLWQIKFALSMCEKFKSLKTDVVDAINYLTENKIKDSLNANYLTAYLKGTINLDEIPQNIIKAIVFYDIPPYGSFSSAGGKISMTDLIVCTRQYSVPISTCIILSKILCN